MGEWFSSCEPGVCSKVDFNLWYVDGKLEKGRLFYSGVPISQSRSKNKVKCNLYQDLIKLIILFPQEYAYMKLSFLWGYGDKEYNDY